MSLVMCTRELEVERIASFGYISKQVGAVSIDARPSDGLKIYVGGKA
ncbi:hypothetical protein [Paenibacillus lautus]|nr:hypothetical protein [Paenibacillus lautus]